MQRRTAAAVAAATLAGLIGLTAGSAQAEKVKIQVALTAGRDPNRNIIQDYGNVLWTDELRQELQKIHPDLDLEFVVADLDKVLTMMAGGVGPDIVNGCCSDFHRLGVQGAFLDLTPHLGTTLPDYMSRQTFWPPQWEAFQHKGRQFGLPQYLGTIAIYYNVDLFQAAGLPEPSPRLEENNVGWEELREIAKRLTRDVNGDGKVDQWGFLKPLSANRVAFWMRAAGANFYVDGDHSRSDLDSPGAIAALEFLQSLRWDDGVIPPPGVSASFTAGTAAMWEDGSWKLIDLLGVQKDGSPKVPFTWDVMPVPKGPVRRATMATIDGYAINKLTKHPEAALKVLDFLVTPTANAILAKYLGLQPANRAVVPQYIRLMQQMNRSVRDVHVHVFTDAGPYAHPQYLYSDQAAADNILNGAYQRIFDQRAPVRVVMEEAVGRLNRVLLATSRPAQSVPPQSLRWAGAAWTAQEVGTLIPGGTEVKGNNLLMRAEGKDIWGTADAFRFTYQKVRGDFTATVALLSVPDTDPWSKAGLMVRASTAPDAANATVIGTGANGIRFQWRAKAGAPSQSQNGGAWSKSDVIYLRLVRQRDEIRAYRSADGQRWQEVGRTRVDLPDEALVGLAVTSHALALHGQAEFTQWHLDQ